MAEPLLTTDDAAEILVVPRRTLERWRYLGGGPPFIRLPKCVRYRPEDLEAWVMEGA